MASQGYYPLPARPTTVRVRGTVFGLNDQPVDSGTVSVTPLLPTEGSNRITVTINPDGSYETEVPAGTWVEMYTESGKLTNSFWGIFHAFSNDQSQSRDLWLTDTAVQSGEPVEPVQEASQAFAPSLIAHSALGPTRRMQ
jgi:hypothetical protein